MNLYKKIKKEHLFIFLVIFTALVVFDYFSEFNYTGLVVKDNCYDKGYSCCFPEEGRGVNHFSLDETCKDKTCWDYCEKSETKNLITGDISFIDSILNWFKELFKKETVGELVSGQTCPSEQNKLFTVSSTEGEGHASISLSGPNSYGNSVCSSKLQLDNIGTELIALSEPTNAHVEKPDLNNYNNLIKVKLDNDLTGTFNIYYQNTDCDPGDELLFSISDVTSAHVGPGDLYDLKACVNISTSTQTCSGQSGTICSNSQACEMEGTSIPFTSASDTSRCCVGGSCVEIDSGECGSNEDCSDHLLPICNLNSGNCEVGCISDDDCGRFQNYPICNSGICIAENPNIETNCNNNINDDGDNWTNPTTGVNVSLIDCKDPDCNNVVVGPNGQKCELNNEKTCNDGFDNDRDGATDCEDYVNCLCTRFSVDDVSVTLADGTGGNILTNPNFESEIGGWNGYPNNSSFNFTINTAPQYSKSGKSLNITTNNTYAGITQRLFLQPNSLYKYSAWVYVTYGRVGMSFWGDDRASLANFTTPYNAQTGWYYLENYILTNSNSGQANGYNNEITIYSWPNTAQEICDDGENNDIDAFIDCADPDCNNSIHYEQGIEKRKCEYLIEKTCNDGFDNDRDGATDNADADCSPTLPPETNCANGIDDDGDGIIDGFDKNCNTPGNTPYYINFDKIEISNTTNYTYSNQEVDIKCGFHIENVLGNTLNAASLRDNAYPCIKSKIDNTECTNRQNMGYTVRFYDCNVGSSGSKVISCELDDNCNSGNQVYVNMDVRNYEYCNYGVNAWDIDLDNVEIEEYEYETGDLVEMNVSVTNFDTNDNDLTVVASAVLFDVNNGEEVVLSSPVEKLIPFNTQGSFLVTFVVPSSIDGDHDYFVYVKAYEKNNEDDNCIEESFAVELTEGENTLPPCTCVNNTQCNSGYVCDSSASCDEGNGKTGLCVFSNVTTCTNGATLQCNTGSPGICSEGIKTCANNVWGNCIQTQTPLVVDVCGDGKDNDCDRLTDCSDSDCSGLSICQNVPSPSGLTPSEDEDGDGLKDSWELEEFGSTTLVNTANGDYDGDGVSNIQEYLDGTDPNDPNDYLKAPSYWWIWLIGIIILIIIIYFVFTKMSKPRKKSFDNIPNYSRQTYNIGDNKLKNYVKASLLKGYNKEQIKRALKSKGWKNEDIEDAFR